MIRESDKPVGAYQVWHREGDDFRQVGSLKVENLMAAAEVAMNRSPSEWMHWDSNEGKVPDEARRTRTGDVLVSPDGGAFKLVETTHGFTFDSVDFGQLRQAAKEQAEFRKELMDGVKTALTGGASFRQIMQEAAAYGMKPEEVEELRRQVNEEMEDRAQATEPVRPLTLQLIECCQLDVWPGRAAVTDFGLASSSHLGALQYAIREELVTPEELDSAMGYGQKLTEIAQRGNNPYRFVTFRTAWDEMRPTPREIEQEGPER